jgi:hypothetical protein
MSALKMILAGGAAVAALVSAAPVSAQYYPGNPYGGFGGYGGYGGYGNNSQAAVSQCTAAVSQRLNRDQGGYGGYGAYGYGGARVLGISRVEPSFNGGLTIRGVANSGRAAGYAYGYGYNGQLPVDLTFRCRTDYRGFVVDVDIDPAQPNYGQNFAPGPYGNYGQNYAPSPYSNDYSQYGYRRY